MSSVFISFVHEDERVATALQQYLGSNFGVHDVFISSDQWKVYAGEDWLARIKAELQSARVVVLMLSRRSSRRPWVNFEAGAAWLSDKVIVPVCYGNMTVELLPRPYSSLQALRLPSDLYYLLTSIAHHLGVSAAPPPVPRGLREAARAVRDPNRSPTEVRLDEALQRPDPAAAIESALDAFQDES